VAILFQKSNPFPMSIRKNLQLPMLEHGLRGKDQLEYKMRELLIQVGLWDEVKERLEVSALALSGGQQQRLCLARALALDPEAILMDEPCSALDPMSTAAIEELIQQLRHRISVVIVTHNLGQARRISDHTAVFWSTKNGVGELIEFGPTSQVFSNPRTELAAAYIAGLRG
jgi:phosphate transport system ATP-binding protein